MKLPKSFIVVSLLFILFSFCMWLVAAVPAYFKPGAEQSLATFLFWPTFMLLLAAYLLFQLKLALGGNGENDDYGVFKIFQNEMTVSQQSVAHTQQKSSLFGIVMFLLMVVTVGPLLYFLLRMLFPPA